jgi:hypothetical protein
MWDQLRERLYPGTSIPAWSVKNRYLGWDFTAAAVHAEHLEVTGGDIGGSRRITRADFETVADLWPGYIGGAVQRQQIRDASQNSTYILGILRWLTADLRKAGTHNPVGPRP